MKNKNILIVSFTIVIIYIMGCSSSQKTSNKNVAGIYMPGLNLINPSYKIFHKNDTLTEFHFRLDSENILYTRKRGDSTFSANILIHYELTDKSNNQLIDSASINFTDFKTNETQKYLDGTINLISQNYKSYDLLVTFNDLSRDHYIKRRAVINRLNFTNNQNYLIIDTNLNVIFKDYFKNDDHIIIQKNENSPNSKLYLKYYSTNLPIARPPFVNNELKEEITFTPKNEDMLTFDLTNKVNYTIKKRGIYHFQAQESVKEGPTIYNFQENFPKIKSIDNMIGPMRYITTKKEFALLNDSDNKKVAMDNFWSDIAGNNDRARSLIREFFNRVESANDYFTSYLEGWKTDRGIIYIVYGTPNVVYKNKDYENWIYGEENNIMSLNFVFQKVNNPVSDNHFKLNRSPLHKNTWFRAVDNWRSGRIY